MALSQDQRDRIAQLWWEGVTSPQISRDLGITRNTVMGIVTRAKLQRSPNAPLSHRGGGNHRKDRPQPSPPNGNIPTLVTYKHLLQRPEPSLATGTCKWPMGTDLLQDDFFCGQQIQRGSYCKHHANIAYNNSNGRSK
jgi:hypothetical protein